MKPSLLLLKTKAVKPSAAKDLKDSVNSDWEESMAERAGSK